MPGRAQSPLMLSNLVPADSSVPIERYQSAPNTAIFAAAMSSFDSGLNSIVATFTVDWYERVIAPGQDDKKYLFLAKVLSYITGIAVTILAILIYQTGIKSIIDASNKYLGFFGGALLGLFMLGIFTRRAKALPTIFGGILSVAMIFLLEI